MAIQCKSWTLRLNLKINMQADKAQIVFYPLFWYVVSNKIIEKA